MEKIRIGIDYTSDKIGINNTEAAKAEIIRQLLYLPGWDVERIKEVDLYLRLLPNDRRCSYYFDDEYDYISCVAPHGDNPKQHIVVTIGGDNILIKVIGDIYTIDDELELSNLALNISCATSDCRNKSDLEVIKDEAKINIHDVADAKKAIITLVDKHWAE